MNPNIRKGDTVILNNNVAKAWTNQIIPAGTKCRVWKTRRCGEIAVTVIGDNSNISLSNISLFLHKSQVTKIDQPIANQPKPGDIFTCCGGYEQTNVAFYKVISVTKSMATVCEVGATRKYTGSMCGECTPNVNETHWRSKVKRVKISYYNDEPMFKGIWGTAFRWKGEPMFFSEWH